MILNLADKNPLKLLTSVQGALAKDQNPIRIELIGPGSIVNDAALMLFHELRSRPPGRTLHVHSHTCLFDGAVLLWLAADTRTMRPDAWIQISEQPVLAETCHSSLRHYPTAVPIGDESGAQTDLRTIFRYLDEYLPTGEVAGLRLFQPELVELGLIVEEGMRDPLATMLGYGEAKPTRQRSYSRRGSKPC
jgi:hypothetical protein